MSFSKKYHYHCRLRFRNLEKKQKYFQKYLLMLEYLLKLQQEWLASLRIQISQFLGLVPKNKTNDYSTNCCFLQMLKLSLRLGMCSYIQRSGHFLRLLNKSLYLGKMLQQSFICVAARSNLLWKSMCLWRFYSLIPSWVKCSCFCN